MTPLVSNTIFSLGTSSCLASDAGKLGDAAVLVFLHQRVDTGKLFLVGVHQQIGEDSRPIGSVVGEQIGGQHAFVGSLWAVIPEDGG